MQVSNNFQQPNFTSIYKIPKGDKKVLKKLCEKIPDEEGFSIVIGKHPAEQELLGKIEQLLPNFSTQKVKSIIQDSVIARATALEDKSTLPKGVTEAYDRAKGVYDSAWVSKESENLGFSNVNEGHNFDIWVFTGDQDRKIVFDFPSGLKKTDNKKDVKNNYTLSNVAKSMVNNIIKSLHKKNEVVFEDPIYYIRKNIELTNRFNKLLQGHSIKEINSIEDI